MAPPSIEILRLRPSPHRNTPTYTSIPCRSPYPPDSPEGIRHRAKSILEIVSQAVPDRKISTSPLFLDAMDINRSAQSQHVDIISSTDTSIQKELSAIEPQQIIRRDSLAMVIPVIIQEGWLEAVEVAKYEMTNRTAELDANLWKCLFRQNQTRLQQPCQWTMYEHRRGSLLNQLVFDSGVEYWFAFGLFISMVTLPTVYVKYGLEMSWNVWSKIFGTVALVKLWWKMFSTVFERLILDRGFIGHNITAI